MAPIAEQEMSLYSLFILSLVIRAHHFPCPALLIPPATLAAPASMLVVASASPLATGRPALLKSVLFYRSYSPSCTHDPVAPSIVSPRPLYHISTAIARVSIKKPNRPKAPTVPPTVLVNPPTVLPRVDVTNFTPEVTPLSC